MHIFSAAFKIIRRFPRLCYKQNPVGLQCSCEFQRPLFDNSVMDFEQKRAKIVFQYGDSITTETKVDVQPSLSVQPVIITVEESRSQLVLSKVGLS